MMKRDHNWYTEQVAFVLGDHLRHYFHNIALNDHGIQFTVHQKNWARHDNEDAMDGKLLLHPPDGSEPIAVDLQITGSGGNVYYITTQIDGKRQKYALAVPDRVIESEELSPETIHIYTKEVCNQMLVELQRVIGKRQLRDATRKTIRLDQ